MRFATPLSPLALTTLALVAASCASTKEAAPAEPAAPVVASPFASEVGMGVAYIQTRSADLVEAVGSLLQAVESKNLAAAQRAYCEARAPYEEVEVLARMLPTLHRAIDARAYEFPEGERSDDFKGFHRIETYLFAREQTEPAVPYAMQLLEDVEELQAVLAENGNFDASHDFASMIERCYEISSKTITSEEEMWSEQTLLVIKHGWIGVHSQYRHFAGKVRTEDPRIAERLNRAYREAMELVAEDFPSRRISGTPYPLINRTKRRQIADASIKFGRYLEEAQAALGLIDA